MGAYARVSGITGVQTWSKTKMSRGYLPDLLLTGVVKWPSGALQLQTAQVEESKTSIFLYT